jgi:hypothetical protein
VALKSFPVFSTFSCDHPSPYTSLTKTSAPFTYKTGLSGVDTALGRQWPKPEE